MQGRSFLSLPPDEQQRMIQDLETYRRELARLLQEEEEGRFALVSEGKVVSVWDTAGDALQAAQLLYGEAPISVYQVKAQVLRRFGQAASEENSPQCQP